MQEDHRVVNSQDLSPSVDCVLREQDLRMFAPRVGMGVSLDGSAPVEWPKTSGPVKLPKKSRKNVKAPVKATKKMKLAKAKRPLSAYNIFFRDQRDHVSNIRRQSPPGEVCPSIAKIISNQWKAITPEVRARYDALAANEKLRDYNERQGWIDYSKSESLGEESDPVACYNQTESHPNPMPKAQDDDTPWPWESIEDIASKLDPASIDFIIRAFA